MRNLAPILALCFTGNVFAQVSTWQRFEKRVPVFQQSPLKWKCALGMETISGPSFVDGTEWVSRVGFPKPGAWRCEWPGGGEQIIRAGKNAERNDLARYGWPTVRKGERFLRHAEGRPFFWLGDTVWFASVRASTTDWKDYVTDRAAKGFTVVQVSAVRTGDGNATPADTEPFDAAGRWNEAFWKRLDAMVLEANRQGLVVLLVGWGRPSHEAYRSIVASDEFAREVAARFGGDAVIFSPNFDGAYEETYATVARNLRKYLPRHLITQHPNTRAGQNELYSPHEYLDFQGLQSGHHGGNLERAYIAARQWARTLRNQEPVRPVINIEAMYDGRGSDHGEAWRGMDARRLGWISWLSGSMGYTYGAGETARKVPGTTGGLWGFSQQQDAPDYWRKVLSWPSSTEMSHLRKFFTQLPWWDLEPIGPATVQDPWEPVMARTRSRNLIIAYSPGGKPILTALTAGRKRWRGQWYNPRTGQFRLAKPGSDGSWIVPEAGRDWVLVLR
jgi:hypothetical protein